MESNIKSFGRTSLRFSKEDVIQDPNNPRMKMYDEDDELVGVFSLETGEVLEDIDLDYYDKKLFSDLMELNQSHFLNTWEEYKGFLVK